jgi:ribonuclease R
VGHFDESRRGFGFVLNPHGDIFVPARLKAGAMDGDIVEVVITGQRRGKKEGKIVGILERKFTKIVGVVEKKGKNAFLIPSDRRITRPVILSDSAALESGDIVESEVVRYPNSENDPIYAVPVEVLGKEGEAGIDIEVLIRMHGLPVDFPEDVKKEAERVAVLPQDELKKRKDLRSLFTVTIDGLDAKDFDDAVSCRKEGENFRLWVHIADVAHYVREGTALFNEAMERAFSVYLVDRVIPMLPFELSAGICSLKPNEERLSITAEMLINPDGEVMEYGFYESVIRSDFRLTYEEIDESIKEGYFNNPDVENLISVMLELKDILEIKRERRGALNFEIPEAKVILDENGRPVDVFVREKTPATSIIEEAMIVTNETVASFMMQHEYPCIYRVHERPDESDIEFAKAFLAELGYPEATSLRPSPKDFQKIIKKAEKRPEKVLVNILLLRCLRKARYAVEPLGHFGLATQSYLHFTSPIRRFPDLIVHMVLKKAMAGKKISTSKSDTAKLESIAEHCSVREIEAETAERDSQELKLYELMRDKYLGEVFEGIISGVTQNGFYVELPNTAEGFVNISELYDDYYIAQPEKFEIYGRKTGKVFRLGEVVIVQVVLVSPAERFMKLRLV